VWIFGCGGIAGRRDHPISHRISPTVLIVN
jgi:hypothetical protein